jgi:Dolichyl-phosphate-mannose-protein mannosyltransferase
LRVGAVERAVHGVEAEEPTVVYENPPSAPRTPAAAPEAESLNVCVSESRPALRRWEITLAAIAALAALVLGFANLGLPSVWHDEAVHILVAKSIVATGKPLMPSGEPLRNGNAYNYLLALFIALGGDSEPVVRAPALLFAVVNVILTFLLTRRLLGTATALVAAFALALSPWSVAWAREARFYSLQQTAYLAFISTAWRFTHAEKKGQIALFGSAALAVCVFSFFISWHSLLFVAPVAVYALLMGIVERRLRSRWTLVIAACAALGALAVLYSLSLNALDQETVYRHSRLGGSLTTAPGRLVRDNPWFYLSWLGRNLSKGTLILAFVGTILLLAREKRQGLFAVLAFWVPVLVLSLLIGYRRQRFMFFAYPFYGVMFSYALVELARVLGTPRVSWRWVLSAPLIIAFGARFSVTAFHLVGDSVEIACGAAATVERRHPAWRKPCLYVREHLSADTVVLTTTFSPAFYYVGRVDQWYPSRDVFWEAVETGMEGLPGLDELRPYVRDHPKGYFLCEWRRFGFRSDIYAEEIAWVDEHMTLIEEASSSDVTLYAWGM